MYSMFESDSILCKLYHTLLCMLCLISLGPTPLSVLTSYGKPAYREDGILKASLFDSSSTVSSSTKHHAREGPGDRVLLLADSTPFVPLALL
jgi:hypothetical protein